MKVDGQEVPEFSPGQEQLELDACIKGTTVTNVVATDECLMLEFDGCYCIGITGDYVFGKRRPS